MNNTLVQIFLISGVVFLSGSLATQAHTAENSIETRAHSDVDAHNVDSDDDGLSDGTDRANYNNTRSNRSTIVGDDADTDQDGHVDIDVRANGDAQPEVVENERIQDSNAGITDRPTQERDLPVGDRDADSDSDAIGDGEESTERASYNNSRSNRATVKTKEIDKASPKLMSTLSIDKSSPLLYEGVSIRAPQVCNEHGDCDDEDPVEPPTRRNISVQVFGTQVRDWSDEQKAMVHERLATADEVSTANDFGIRVASAAIDNESVIDVKSSPEETEVTYASRVYILGFIPKSVTAVARADTGGEVAVDYPWYGLFSRKGDQTQAKTLVRKLRTAHNALIATES